MDLASAQSCTPIFGSVKLKYISGHFCKWFFPTHKWNKESQRPFPGGKENNQTKSQYFTHTHTHTPQCIRSLASTTDMNLLKSRI